MKYFEQVLKKFLALSLRERVLMGLAIAAVVYFLADIALFAPERQKAKDLQKKIDAQKVELANLTKVVGDVSAQKGADPMAVIRAERDSLQKSAAELDAVVQQATTTVQLGQLIRAVVSNSPGVTLVSLKTLPVSTFYSAGSAAPKPADNKPTAVAATTAFAGLTLYKHGVEVAVKGKYLALVPYIQNLQGRSQRLFWADIHLDATTYPDTVIKMTIYTLSDQSDSPLG